MSKEKYPGQFRDHRITAAAAVGLTILGGVAVFNQSNNSKLNDREACIAVPALQGDGLESVVDRINAASEADVTGKVVVFKPNGETKVIDKSIPLSESPTQLDMVDSMGFEHADREACVAVNGIPAEKLENIDLN